MSRQLPDLPNVDASLFESPKADHFKRVGTSTHAPKILLLYGSLRERSYSKGRMKPSAFYQWVVDVMEELMKFTLLTRDVAPISSIDTVNVGKARKSCRSG